MLKRNLALAALGGLLALPACTSGQAGVEPHYTPVNLANTAKLQFQVGTANYQGTVYLNTVVTYRSTNGLSALLDSTPTITLPFTNTAPATVNSGGTTEILAGGDSGTNKISGTQQTNNGTPSSNPLSFAQDTGAFAYGFLSSNSTTTGANNSVFYPAGPRSVQGNVYEGNRMPIYGPAVGRTQRAFYVGPPFATFGAFGTTFLGYPSGFTTFALTPTTGSYSLSVGLVNASSSVPTFTATTSMGALTTLPAFTTAPTYASDGAAGGGTVTVAGIPAGATETAVFMRDISPTAGVVAYYTIVFHGGGTQTGMLPDGHIASGDAVDAVAVAFDYPAMEAVPMGSGPPQAPVINNSGGACSFSGTTSTCPGTADISLSPTGGGVQ